MASIHSVCVYCGSSHGSDPRFVAQARAFGADLARNGVRLVYGGGGIGLMGEVATATALAGGKVTGIIPEFLISRERAFAYEAEMIVTADMHERKRLMFERADAFVALPGGVGTLEELVEQLTWAQLGQHAKPILVLNTGGFWDPFLSLLDHMRSSAFIHATNPVNLLVAEEVSEILPRLRAAAAGVSEDELHTPRDADVVARL
ncbi:TIGR00730 family Rossman fold protein [Azorhizobium doebereinerae]|uniref:LOG family protein n=1 Tax=Azorhizobium doebereinerae TaxID=281091 RepID=UPI0004259536|nr:TIGR00730 family Rossman fold protein [Azorhizobium doebereinerae]